MLIVLMCPLLMFIFSSWTVNSTILRSPQQSGWQSMSGVNLLQGDFHITHKRYLEFTTSRAKPLSMKSMQSNEALPDRTIAKQGTKQSSQERDVKSSLLSAVASVRSVPSRLVEVFWGTLAMLIAISLWRTASWWADSGTSIVLGWMVLSISMNLVNKQAVMVFPCTSLLVVLQMLIAAVFLLVFEFRRMSFKHWRDIGKWMVVPFLFSGILATSLCALKYTTVYTVMVLRSALPLFTVGIEEVLVGSQKHVTSWHILCMLLALGGTVVYSRWNLSVTAQSAWWMSCNMLIIVMDRGLQRYLLNDPNFHVTPQLCSFITNAVGIFPMLGIAAWSGEIHQWDEAILDISPTSWFWVLVSGSCGCCLGYLALHTQKLVCVTTFLMMQNMNKLVVLIASVLVFGDTFTFISAAGCAVSLGGFLWYCCLQRCEIGFTSSHVEHIFAKEPRIPIVD
eukprot:gnl/MRDRNA2_/MRDRNA2_64892_c0_seq1.p1 gnl/MRDRNA2_/MRDRNA2_64892_c0~~gnl/MRDRNA2_/MRDRNA2_64892_c0_seq1.p1  ORF type:complete len:451 (-),score=37.96 gnl/MRDRNA2_/MRDRNA2_64892_c0_seq1:111-1463(-)